MLSKLMMNVNVHFSTRNFMKIKMQSTKDLLYTDVSWQGTNKFKIDPNDEDIWHPSFAFIIMSRKIMKQILTYLFIGENEASEVTLILYLLFLSRIVKKKTEFFILKTTSVCWFDWKIGFNKQKTWVFEQSTEH